MNIRAITLILISVCLLSVTGCAINPASGTPDFVFMSEQDELELGKELHEKIIASTPIYQDEKLAAYIDDIGQKLVKNSHRPDLKYTFTIIDSPDINAFALPGGYIYVNRGLLSYLDSEAQLAAVMAHEIGHVTARHSVKQDAARKGSSVVTVLSVLTTGSSVIGDVTDLWGTAAVMGYGRDMELEADSLGAEYLYNTNYNPKAMIEVIGVLKDQEKFSRRMARETGKQVATYHGVFATHPRNDERLQEVVGKAGDLSKDKAGSDNRDQYREATEGLLYGINYNPKTAKTAENNTYSHSKLGFSIDFPKGWESENQRQQILSKAPDGHARMSIQVDLLRQPVAPDVYIREVLGIPFLQQSEPFTQFGLVGHTGIQPAGDKHQYPTRIAVIYQGRRIYIIRGEVSGPATATEAATEENAPPQKTDDEQFVASIHSFRPSRTARRVAGKSKSLHYVKANERTTFKRLAEHVELGKYAEAQLRLLNGYYPRGEPQVGEWIKIVR
ncbi:M48 family metalloprotease [Aestuariicella hydrocarbonica]|uniref:M48 family metalloprotease n=1 Tax=Pseudomaricurvus hydrocarbonicus TaxID=1470433 RepID=A0A9E5JP78_9GAMM|nr:M48 family metalloprotease [Aestuariicella hydrocarbonica]NHO64047.1 M48 family metalloprotease [Aestuariicella hydrocarbonica]